MSNERHWCAIPACPCGGPALSYQVCFSVSPCLLYMWKFSYNLLVVLSSPFLFPLPPMKVVTEFRGHIAGSSILTPSQYGKCTVNALRFVARRDGPFLRSSTRVRSVIRYYEGMRVSNFDRAKRNWVRTPLEIAVPRYLIVTPNRPRFF